MSRVVRNSTSYLKTVLYPLGSIGLSSSLFFCAFGSQAEPIVIASIDFPPLSQVSDKGEISGPGVEAFSTILDRLDIEYKWLGFTQNRLEQEVYSAGVDLIVATKNYNEIDEQLFYTRHPITCVEIGIFSAHARDSLGKPEELSGKLLLVHDYFDKEDVLRNLQTQAAFSWSQTSNRDAAVKMLQLARTDYYLDFKLPAQNRIHSAKLNFAYTKIAEEAIYLGAPKARERSKQLIDSIDQALTSGDFVFPLIKSGHTQQCTSKPLLTESHPAKSAPSLEYRS